jgi:hypothetical protein
LSSRPPASGDSDTARLTLPPQDSAHTQTALAGQGHCHRRRPTKKAPASQRTRTHPEIRESTRADGATDPSSSSPSSSSSTLASKDGGGEPLTRFHSTLPGTPTDGPVMRWRGAFYPVSFDSTSTGHPTGTRLGGGEPLIQLHSTLLQWAPQQTQHGFVGTYGHQDSTTDYGAMHAGNTRRSPLARAHWPTSPMQAISRIHVDSWTSTS